MKVKCLVILEESKRWIGKVKKKESNVLRLIDLIDEGNYEEITIQLNKFLVTDTPIEDLVSSDIGEMLTNFYSTIKEKPELKALVRLTRKAIKKLRLVAFEHLFCDGNFQALNTTSLDSPIQTGDIIKTQSTLDNQPIIGKFEEVRHNKMRISMDNNKQYEFSNKFKDIISESKDTLKKTYNHIGLNVGRS